MAGYEDIAKGLTGIFGTGKIQKDKEEKDLANFIMDQYTKAKTSKEETKTKWVEHIKLWRGDHWKKNRAKWKSTTVENICFSIIESMVPLMVDKSPTIIYAPQTAEDEDLAGKMNQVASFVWSVDDMDEKMPTILRDVLILGTGCVKVRWEDSKLGGMGEITTDVLDPFCVFPDPDATDPSNLQWVIIKTKMPIKQIQATYGKGVPSDREYNDDHIRPTDVSRGQDTNWSSSHATVLEQWYKDDNGNVALRVVSNGVQLDDRPTPYEINEFPIIFFYDHKLNGEFWGIGEMENLKPLQYEMNKVRAMIMDNMISQGNTMLVVDSTAGVKLKDLRNEPGLIIEKQPGGQIQRLEPPSLPPYFQNQIEINRLAMQNVSGINDISKGIAGGQTAASAIQILTENSQTRVRGKLKNIENSVKKLGKWYLAMVRQFYQEPRIISLIDGDEGFKFTEFDGRELRPRLPKYDEQGNPVFKMDPQTGQPVMDPQTGQPVPETEEGFTEFTVKVSSGSSMYLNKSAKYQQTLELFQNGAVDIETLLKSADVGETQEIIKRMIAYGKLGDPTLPKVDVAKILADLGMKINLSAQNPDVIMEMLNQMKSQAQSINQDEITLAQAQQGEADRMAQQQARTQAQVEVQGGQMPMPGEMPPAPQPPLS